MNKKGIALKFLVTIILAIIIFAPACIIASKFFRLSSQAKENFIDFTNEAKGMERAEQGERKTSILILDQGTALAYFEPEKEEIIVDVDGWAGRDYQVLFKRPSSCREGRCLCLIYEKEIEDTGGTAGNRQATIKPKKAFCETNFNVDLILNNCGIGKAVDVESYSCSRGWVVERLIIDEARDEVKWFNNDAHYEAPRRLEIQMVKERNSVYFET